MARTRNPGLLHSVPALLIGGALVTSGVTLLMTKRLDEADLMLTPSRFMMPVWLEIVVALVLGSAILAFGVLSVRQTWREVRDRPARDRWLGYSER